MSSWADTLASQPSIAENGAKVDKLLTGPELASIESLEAQWHSEVWGQLDDMSDAAKTLSNNDYTGWLTLSPGTRLLFYHAALAATVAEKSSGWYLYPLLPYGFVLASSDGQITKYLDAFEAIYKSVAGAGSIVAENQQLADAGKALTAAMTPDEVAQFHRLEDTWTLTLYGQGLPVDQSGAGIIQWKNTQDVGTRLIFYENAATSGDRNGKTKGIESTLPAIFAYFADSTSPAYRKLFYDGADKMKAFYDQVAPKAQLSSGSARGSSGGSSGGGAGIALLLVGAVLAFGGGKKR